MQLGRSRFFGSRLTAEAVDRRTPDPIPALAMFVWRACATIATMALKVAEAAGNLANLFDTSFSLTWHPVIMISFEKSLRVTGHSPTAIIDGMVDGMVDA